MVYPHHEHAPAVPDHRANGRAGGHGRMPYRGALRPGARSGGASIGCSWVGTGSPAHVRHGPDHRSAGLGGDVCGSREADAGHDAARGAGAGGGKLATVAGATARTPQWSTHGDARRHRRARYRLDAVAHRPASHALARRVRAHAWQRRAVARGRCRHRPRARHAARTLAREHAAHVHAAHADLPGPHRRARPEAAERDHNHEGPRAGAGGAGRSRDRGRTLPRPAARHPVRRKGPARHGRHCHDVRRGAVPQPRAHR